MSRSNNGEPPNNLRDCRKLARLDQQDVGYLIGIKNYGRISEWENGKAIPSRDNLIKLSLVYEVLQDRLYTRLRDKYKKDIEERRKHLDTWRKRDKRRKLRPPN